MKTTLFTTGDELARRMLLALLLALLVLLARPSRSQNVGIGTTTPTQTLDVNGQLRVRGLAGTAIGLPQVQADGTLGLFSSSNPTDSYATQPVLLNSNPAGGTATGLLPLSVAVSGSTAYVVTGSGSLQVFDVSSPASPVLRGTATTGGGFRSVAVNGSTAYVVAGNSLQVFDVSNPASPVLRGTASTSSGPSSVAVSGSTAYVVTSSNTLQVFDVANPTTPALRGTVGTGTNPYGVAVNGSTAYVVNASSSTLQVFQVSSVRPLGLLADGSLGLTATPSLTLSGQNLGISGGNTVTLPLQTLTLSGQNLGISGGNTVTLSPQTLTLSGQSLGISGGNTVTLPSPTPPLLTLSGQNLSIGGGNTVTLPSPPAPQLTVFGRSLSISGGNTVALPFDNLGNHTATQNLDLARYQLVGDGGSQGLFLTSKGAGVFAGPVLANGVLLTSDARFRQEVRPLVGALAAVLRLRGVRYRWNALGIAHGGQADAKQIGLLAQELEAEYPELVHTDEQGYKRINYAQLTPVLLEAIKELAAQNASLKAEAVASTARFEQRLQALEATGTQAVR